MDRMNPDSQTNIPTEQLLQKLADEHNTEQVLATLDTLAGTGEAHELTEKLEALGLKFELAGVFGRAKNKLDQLYGKHPDVVEADVDTALQNKTETLQKVRDFEEGIAGYLQTFRAGVDQAVSEPEPANSFMPLKQALSEEDTKDQAFQRLAELPELSAGQCAWIREQAKDTALGVTELLWEIVGVGRDFVGLLGDENQAEAAKLAFKDWQSSVKSEFPEAGKLLSEAASWLSK